MSSPDYKPAWWLPSAHLQTLWPALFRCRPGLEVIPERVELSDGDFIDINWYGEPDAPLVMILHGLEGSIDSHYALSLMQQLKKTGFSTVFMHFRGCSGVPNRLPRSYHSGDTDDMREVINIIQSRHDKRVFAAVGFSLGGNALLKWLGESGKANPLACAVAVSVPFVLSDAAARLRRGISRLYESHLMRLMRKAYLRKFAGMASPLDVDVNRLHGFREFDDRVTAPLHGFRNVDHYYGESSCRQYLKKIAVPTCIIHSRDDPFMYPESVPERSELNANVDLLLTESGGHVGFVTGRVPWKATYWYETAVSEFLVRHAGR